MPYTPTKISFKEKDLLTYIDQLESFLIKNLSLDTEANLVNIKADLAEFKTLHIALYKSKSSAGESEHDFIKFIPNLVKNQGNLIFNQIVGHGQVKLASSEWFGSAYAKAKAKQMKAAKTKKLSIAKEVYKNITDFLNTDSLFSNDSPVQLVTEVTDLPTPNKPQDSPEPAKEIGLFTYSEKDLLEIRDTQLQRNIPVDLKSHLLKLGLFKIVDPVVEAAEPANE